MNKRNLLLMLVFYLLIFNPFTNKTFADDRDVPYVYMYYNDLSSITQDGTIGATEYPSNFLMENLAGEVVTKVWWAHDNTTIAIALQINGTGWLGMGFGEQGIGMAGANIVMASYDPETNSVTIQDMSSSGQVDPIPDKDQYNFTSVGGSEIDGITTIEFTVPMQSNDADGHDHFWHLGDRVGFFTAYQKTKKAFDREHNEHSRSETVEILDKSFAPPVDSSLNFFVEDNKNGTVTLHSEFNGGLTVDDHEVGYFQKTIFGNVFIGDVFTNEEGHAEMRINIEKTGEIEFVAIFYGDINHVRKTSRSILMISEVVKTQKEEYGDLRDTVGGRFMRVLLIFTLFFLVSWLVYLYTTTLLDVLKIKKIGDRAISKQKEAMNTK